MSIGRGRLDTGVLISESRYKRSVPALTYRTDFTLSARPLPLAAVRRRVSLRRNDEPCDDS